MRKKTARNRGEIPLLTSGFLLAVKFTNQLDYLTPEHLHTEKTIKKPSDIQKL